MSDYVNRLRFGLNAILKGGRTRSESNIRANYDRAIRWITDNSVDGGGIAVTNVCKLSYPEVTGYFIPTLLNWGERERAIGFARWLVEIQNADGSWSDAAGKCAYTFDTGQILKGLVSILPVLPEVEGAIRRGCDWILTRIEPSGKVTTPDKSAWCLPNGRMVSEYIHLYALEPLRDMGKQFSDSRYSEAVENALAYYIAQPDLVCFNTLSHFHAYVMEALVDLGRPDVAARGMAEVERLQRAEGSVPAYPDADWVCSTGLAQYAIVWYKLGQLDRARKAFDYLCKLQNRSGGFCGSYGRGANYFHNEEISWAVKFFLDACFWHIRSSFDAEVEQFPETLDEGDGRYQAVVRGLGNVSGRRVLDAGCGKGRFSRNLLRRYPSSEVWGVDISDAMLRCAPPPIRIRQGTLLRLPFENGYFDAVFSVEALEHSVNPEAAVRELCRVVKPSGTVVIVDKNSRCRGALAVEAWECWFEQREVRGWLSHDCTEVRSEFIPWDGKTQMESLFIVWHGTKREVAC